MRRCARLLLWLGCLQWLPSLDQASALAQQRPDSSLGGLFGKTAPPSPPAGLHADLEQLAHRFDQLARRADAGIAASAIETGRQALNRARAQLVAGRMAEAQRATQIAWAALSLASRRVAAAAATKAAIEAELRAAAAAAQRARVEQELAAAKARVAGSSTEPAR